MVTEVTVPEFPVENGPEGSIALDQLLGPYLIRAGARLGNGRFSDSHLEQSLLEAFNEVVNTKGIKGLTAAELWERMGSGRPYPSFLVLPDTEEGRAFQLAASLNGRTTIIFCEVEHPKTYFAHTFFNLLKSGLIEDIRESEIPDRLKEASEFYPGIVQTSDESSFRGSDPRMDDWKRIVQSEWEKLSDRDKLIVRMRFWGTKKPEIMRRLGLDLKTVDLVFRSFNKCCRVAWIRRSGL